MDWEEASKLGKIIEIRDAWCPEHGRVRPEMFAFPFTVTDEYLKTFPPACRKGCEQTIELDAHVTDTPHPSQHRFVYRDKRYTPEERQKLFGHPSAEMEAFKVKLKGKPQIGITPEQEDNPSEVFERGR